MSFPRPEPGLVIAYAYLWRNEARKGLEEGLKDGRPCMILFVAERVVILPITHTFANDDGCLKIPASVKTAVGLDDRPQWIVTSECNTFVWPGFDVRIEPQYGPVPPNFFNKVVEAVRTRIASASVAMIARD